MTDFAKFGRAEQCHIAFQALDEFRKMKGSLPQPWCKVCAVLALFTSLSLVNRSFQLIAYIPHVGQSVTLQAIGWAFQEGALSFHASCSTVVSFTLTFLGRCKDAR